MQLYQSPRNAEGGQAGALPGPRTGGLAPFPILLRVPYYASATPIAPAPAERGERREAVAAQAVSLFSASPPVPAADRPITFAEPSRQPEPSPCPTTVEVPASSKPAAPGLGKWLAALFFVLVTGGLAVHWHFTSLVPSPLPDTSDKGGATEMIIVPVTAAVAPAATATQEPPGVELLPPVEAELGPDIIPIEEGKTP